jgi:hypothetical protein
MLNKLVGATCREPAPGKALVLCAASSRIEPWADVTPSGRSRGSMSRSVRAWVARNDIWGQWRWARTVVNGGALLTHPLGAPSHHDLDEEEEQDADDDEQGEQDEERDEERDVDEAEEGEERDEEPDEDQRRFQVYLVPGSEHPSDEVVGPDDCVDDAVDHLEPIRGLAIDRLPSIMHDDGRRPWMATPGNE